MIALERTSVRINFLPPNATEHIKTRLLFVTSGVQYYFNSQHLLYKLGKDARALYDYLCERMNNENNVSINAAFKTEFIVHFFKLTSNKKQISENSIGNYVSKLVELGLLIPNGNTRNAFYCINPKYAFKGTKSERINLIKKLINVRGTTGLSLHGLINATESQFLNNEEQGEN